MDVFASSAASLSFLKASGRPPLTRGVIPCCLLDPGLLDNEVRGARARRHSNTPRRSAPKGIGIGKKVYEDEKAPAGRRVDKVTRTRLPQYPGGHSTPVAEDTLGLD